MLRYMDTKVSAMLWSTVSSPAGRGEGGERGWVLAGYEGEPQRQLAEIELFSFDTRGLQLRSSAAHGQ